MQFVVETARNPQDQLAYPRVSASSAVFHFWLRWKAALASWVNATGRRRLLLLVAFL
jgi:hypothetical protein